MVSSIPGFNPGLAVVGVAFKRNPALAGAPTFTTASKHEGIRPLVAEVIRVV